MINTWISHEKGGTRYVSNTKSNKAAKHQCTTFPSHKATAASATSELRWPDEETRVVMVGAENVGTESGDRKGVPVCQKIDHVILHL